jgi:uncharacterized Zn-binding protein involved in type VI secretion
MAQNVGKAAKVLPIKSSLTYISSTDDNGVGMLFWDQQNCYRWVYNGHSAALTVGQVCFHLDTDGEAFFEKVYDGLTGDLSQMAGVVLATSLTTLYYGGILVMGYYASIQMYASGGTAIAAGDSLIGVNGQAYAIYGTTTGTAPLHVRRIISLEALASSITVATAKKGIVQCL